jgi:pimeloyl-ACP methyl ester carboxylesterase
VLHAPAAGVALDHGVVVCPPLAQEHVRSHGALRQLALSLARAGHHVLRFDWFGVGDSAGSLDQATLTRFREDLAAAIEELVDRTGVRAYSLFAVRLGAAVALTTRPASSPVRLVLWDPVVHGADYLRGQRALHESLLDDANRFWQPSHGLRATPGELVGFRYGLPLLEELRDLDLRRADVGHAPVHVLVSEGCTAPLGWPSRSIAATPRWEQHQAVEEKIFAAPLAQAVLDAMGAST